MNVGILALLTIFISFMLLLVQRAEAKRRLFVIVVMLVIGELIRRYVFYRDVHPFPLLLIFPGAVIRPYLFSQSIYTEAWLALIIAVVFNLFFYLFIGRYNPVHSSEEIQVIGMDD